MTSCLTYLGSSRNSEELGASSNSAESSRGARITSAPGGTSSAVCRMSGSTLSRRTGVGGGHCRSLVLAEVTAGHWSLKTIGTYWRLVTEISGAYRRSVSDLLTFDDIH